MSSEKAFHRSISGSTGYVAAGVDRMAQVEEEEGPLRSTFKAQPIQAVSPIDTRASTFLVWPAKLV